MTTAAFSRPTSISYVLAEATANASSARCCVFSWKRWTTTKVKLVFCPDYAPFDPHPQQILACLEGKTAAARRSGCGSLDAYAGVKDISDRGAGNQFRRCASSALLRRTKVRLTRRDSRALNWLRRLYPWSEAEAQFSASAGKYVWVFASVLVACSYQGSCLCFSHVFCRSGACPRRKPGFQPRSSMLNPNLRLIRYVHFGNFSQKDWRTPFELALDI